MLLTSMNQARIQRYKTGLMSQPVNYENIVFASTISVAL